jgi:pyruvate/2-oxoglutarate dehydrogenase complex dihydrolipoamide dehydrogenase (E3) component
VQEGFDTVLLAIGRKPETGRLNLQAAGVEITERSHHVKVPIAALHIENAPTE